jgi:hypothetical protein
LWRRLSCPEEGCGVELDGEACLRELPATQ